MKSIVGLSELGGTRTSVTALCDWDRYLNTPEIQHCTVIIVTETLRRLPTAADKLRRCHPYKYGHQLPCLYKSCNNGPMKNVEIVWRTLADAALDGQRDWNSIGDIADAASVAP